MIAPAAARSLGTVLLGGAALAAAALPGTAHAQGRNWPITAGQRATAEQVASQGGVPISELAPNAPDVYTVKRGDTLWAISGMYLLRPWRWPELWGMNMDSIANPHLIYPGQVLYLDKDGNFARLGTRRPGEDGEPQDIRVSPGVREQSLLDAALPTLEPHLIEPFLAEPLVVDADTLEKAPRIVSGDERVFMTTGDRAYARGAPDTPLLREAGHPRHYRVFREAVPLKDPETGEILGYEAQYLGNAELKASESRQEVPGQGGKKVEQVVVPATLELSRVKAEINPGDRLLPSPERDFLNYAPHAPAQPTQASVVSIYGGDANTNWAAQSYVVTINRGERDGVDKGTVLEVISRGARVADKTGPNPKEMLQLPSQRNGYAMVFLTFDRVSYALVMQVQRPVVVGDIMRSPRF